MPYGIKLSVSGDYACFARPEMKVERVSYDVMTPSAARGILEAIHWKPAIRWIVDAIHVLKPIRFQSIRRNEVGHKAPAASIRKAMNSGDISDLALIAGAWIDTSSLLGARRPVRRSPLAQGRGLKRGYRWRSQCEVEIKGQATDDADVKALAAQRWVNAVNRLGQHGGWCYLLVAVPRRGRKRSQRLYRREVGGRPVEVCGDGLGQSPSPTRMRRP